MAEKWTGVLGVSMLLTAMGGPVLASYKPGGHNHNISKTTNPSKKLGHEKMSLPSASFPSLLPHHYTKMFSNNSGNPKATHLVTSVEAVHIPGIEKALRKWNIPFSRDLSGTYIAFETAGGLKQALEKVYENRVTTPGWWHLGEALVKHGVVTLEEFNQSLYELP